MRRAVLVIFALVFVAADSLALAQPVQNNCVIDGTPLPAQCIYLPMAHWPYYLANGDFEQGRAVWKESATNDAPIIVRTAPVPAHSGEYVAWMGGASNLITTLVQTVTVTQPYLSYWVRVQTNEPCDRFFDNIGVDVIGETSAQRLDWFYPCVGFAPGWQRRVVDMREYIGAVVPIRFEMYTDGRFTSSVFLDDIAFTATP